MLINTAHGVASVRRDWINVARTLEAGTMRTCFRVILPAAAPTILTGMRISMGIAWLVIVAAEMLVGNLGIGYFVWNEWNNLSLSNVIFAILVIGVVGMALDLAFGALLQRAVNVCRKPDFLLVRELGRSYGDPRRLRARLLHDGSRRVRLRDRPLGLRQDDDPQHPRRPRSSHGRRSGDGWARDRGGRRSTAASFSRGMR